MIKKVFNMMKNNEALIPEISKSYVPHGCFEIIRKVIRQKIFAPVWVSGLSGNGKTFGVEQACAHEKRELIIINISNDTSEEDLIGSYVLKDGDMIWSDGPVLTAMRKGAVLCLDEIDQARTSIMALNTIAQGKGYYIKKTNEYVIPKEGFTLIGTANTKGDGNGMDKFAGAQIMNEAFLERFSIFIEQEYPSKETETLILKMHTKDTKFIKDLVDIAGELRKSFENGTTDFMLTTRRLVHIAKNSTIFDDNTQAIKMACARFNKEDQGVIIELYSAMNAEKKNVKKAIPSSYANAVWLDEVITY